MNTSLRAFPSTQTLEWVGREVGGKVVGGRRLTGGITSSVHRLAVDVGGVRRQVVLRRWTDIGTDPTPPGDRVRRETATLTGLAGTGVPAPGLLAADPSGAEAGVPALLMTRVPGRVDLMPTEPDRWLNELAAALARVHDARVDAPRDEGWLDDRLRAREISVPDWTSQRGAWETTLRILAGPPPTSVETFTHNDYQHFNLLWRRGRLTGIVDWVYACVAPPERDLGHCRLNLAILYSADWAERFRAAYVAFTGRPLDPYWDLYEIVPAAVMDWGEFIPRQLMGRAPFDRAGMPARIDELLVAAVRRL